MNFVRHDVGKQMIELTLTSIKWCWAQCSVVLQLLLKPDINSHPAQPPLRPNVQALRYLNFGARQISVIAVRGTFAFWHADISSFHRKLALSAWDQNLREKSSASALLGGWWGAVSKRAKILNQRVDSVNGEVKHHHHEGIEFRGSILTTPFLCEADSSHIFLVILTPNTPNMVPGAKDTMTGWTVQPIKKDRFVWEKKADRNFKRKPFIFAFYGCQCQPPVGILDEKMLSRVTRSLF